MSLAKRRGTVLSGCSLRPMRTVRRHLQQVNTDHWSAHDSRALTTSAKLSRSAVSLRLKTLLEWKRKAIQLCDQWPSLGASHLVLHCGQLIGRSTMDIETNGRPDRSINQSQSQRADTRAAALSGDAIDMR